MVEEDVLLELSKKGGLNLLTAYIMGLTGLEDDFAENIAYEICSELDEIIFTRANRYREDDAAPKCEFEI